MLVFACRCRGTGVEPSAPPGVAMESITVTSGQFSENAAIAVDYSCDGKDMMPSIAWSSPPPATKSIAVIIDDPDAPGGTFTHFIAYGIAPDTHELKAGAEPGPPVRIGKNDFGSVRYNGPCPPQGEEHRYRFQVYALDVALTNPEGLGRSDVDSAMSGHVLAEGTLTGLFGH
ncbi:MAG: YbhB/YbcL family Raf kinase inhibitor-like protein [Polyangiaceae bacterium]